ncbi:MAG TPA: hypothetical protein VF170_18630 [Planctomycetaceae bacterium]
MRRPWLARPVLLGCGLFVACGSGTALAETPGGLTGRGGPSDPATPPYRAAAAENPSGPIRATLDRIDVLEPGTSDRRALETAKAALPLDRLTPQNRRRADAVLGNLSMFRAMPTVRLEVDHDAYRYFVEHPDVAVSIWRALGVSKCQLWQTGPDAYETDVGDGSTGVIDVLLRGENDHLILGEGQFKSPLIVKPIRANALLHLRTEYVTRPDGETETVCRGTLFVAFPSQTVETAAKVVSPVTNMVIDRNFEEIGLFAHMMSLAMRNQPGWVENLAGQLDGVLERRRAELLQVTARAYVAHKKRELAREGRPVSADAIAPPTRSGVTPAGR